MTATLTTAITIATTIATTTACALVTCLALTATWSRKPTRRRAATNALHQLLDFLRHRR